MAPGRLLSMGVGLALASVAVPAPAADAPAAGSPSVGRALFIGARRLAAGGPPCGACHAVGGESAPFSAALGPELTRSFEGLPPEAVDGLLQDLPFPTMTPLYAGRALTPAERADLSAFLVEATGKPAPRGAAVAGTAAAIAAGCLAALGLASRRRKGSTRAELLARARVPAAHPRRQRAAPPDRAEVAAPPAAPRAQGGAR